MPAPDRGSAELEVRRAVERRGRSRIRGSPTGSGVQQDVVRQQVKACVEIRKPQRGTADRSKRVGGFVVHLRITLESAVSIASADDEHPSVAGRDGGRIPPD